MPGLSDNYEKYVLWYLFKQTQMPTPPTTLFVGLHTGDPSDVRTVAAGNEITGNAYARAALAPDANSGANVNWNAVIAGTGTAQQVNNKLDIVFPQASGGNWNSGSTIQYFSLWKPSSGGTDDDYLLSGTVTGGGVVVLSGNTLKFLGGTTGNLNFTCD